MRFQKYKEDILSKSSLLQYIYIFVQKLWRLARSVVVKRKCGNAPKATHVC